MKPVEKPNIKLYQPSNGSEGMWFMENHCEQCIHQNPNPTAVPLKNCDICMRSLMYNTKDPEYPIEWRYVDGEPTCTAFVKWDWGQDGDPDDPENPNRPPPPPDPNQLNLFPLWPNDKTFEPEVKSVKAPF